MSSTEIPTPLAEMTLRGLEAVPPMVCARLVRPMPAPPLPRARPGGVGADEVALDHRVVGTRP